MKELSLHILDLVENSIQAGATQIDIKIDETHLHTHIKITVTDNGKGIDPAMLAVISDPFVTSRTTRRVGLGIALFKAASERCEGIFSIQSRQGNGTTVTATFAIDHLDRAPLGDLGATMTTLIAGYPDIGIRYHHILFQDSFTMNTAELKSGLDTVELNDPAILSRIKEMINDFCKQ
ncbi:sensory signal transduction histidine kinase (ATPase domain protein) [Desulforapulum autotrophicum HRM2]|uniref:histidine kinase n=1 Tax=Desulforapulum autotrophicum (strain ATCC 43914 / DSM 3382 / VKM B-1955 / HRM2) TaxID=177437 RepID=C0QAH6_DESAH|nr:ATP-binding protein [Desulforapulum autotrophicum]ACN14761.1 sensory signal transduction histidine kinase (ATPase domain protein) [Desulforapulum autotrophicum HRM2]